MFFLSRILSIHALAVCMWLPIHFFFFHPVDSACTHHQRVRSMTYASSNFIVIISCSNTFCMSIIAVITHLLCHPKFVVVIVFSPTEWSLVRTWTNRSGKKNIYSFTLRSNYHTVKRFVKYKSELQQTDPTNFLRWNGKLGGCNESSCIRLTHISPRIWVQFIEYSYSMISLV